MQLPTILEAGCDGETRLRGIELSTAFGAEESAASKALSFLESNLNYTERVYAKEKHMLISKVLRCLLGAAERIKKEWFSTVEYINEGDGIFGGGVGRYNAGPHSATKVAASNFGSGGIAKAHEDCVCGYEAAVALEAANKFYPPVSQHDE